MIQEILVYAAVILALLFLFRKYIFKQKRKVVIAIQIVIVDLFIIKINFFININD